jgi:hypothetical protein
MAKPKQDELPGIERKLKDLHEAAMDYAEIRDQRQELNRQEAVLKAKLLGLMKKHGKEDYEFEGVHIWTEIEEETVRVRIRKMDEEKSDAA